MKTCPNCGTLLFDDVMTCTKCGQDTNSKDNEGEAPVPDATGPVAQEAEESVPVVAEQEVADEPETEPEGEPETPTTSETTAEEPVSEPVVETTEPEVKPDNEIKESSNKRKKWLEEQDKIKTELASIMSRVGKRKSPSTMFEGGSTISDMPQGQTSSAAPYSRPVGETPQLNPMDQSQVMTQPLAGAPAQPQAPGQTTAPGAQEGLSDFDKKELLRELDDLRTEGYDVSRLETIIEEDPGNAWKAFSEFLDDIEKINKQRTKLENIDTTGFAELTAKKDEILEMANNPDLLQDVISEIDDFEQQLKSKKQKQAAIPAPGPAPGAEEARKIEQIEKYISAGKDDLRLKDYEKALKIFTKTLELDPNNKEIQFFKKKLEAKLTESPLAPSPAQAQAQAPTPVSAPTITPTAEYSPKPAAQQPTSVSVQPQPQVVAQSPVQSQAQVPIPTVQPAMAPAPTPAPRGKKKKKKKKVVSQKPTPTPSAAAEPQPAPGPVPTQTAVNIDDSAIEGPKSAAEYEALGFNAYINKDYPKALEFIENVLELDPNFPNVDNLNNECLMRLGRA
jgi:tetratricopeptide (TPR) repeat protein